MHVPDEVRKCVVFLCSKNADDSYRLLGTAFLVGLEIGSSRTMTLAVTAKHVIDAAKKVACDKSIYMRVNRKNDTCAMWTVPLANWLTHPTDPLIDVSLTILPAFTDEFDYRLIPLTNFATDEVIKQEEISVGEDVFITGLFVNHVGTNRNIPIVRVGNIAAMPEEPIATKDGNIDAYLLEARSIGGLSGSPVFVHLGIVRRINGQVVFLQGKAGAKFHLIGLVRGHFDLPSSHPDAVIADGSGQSVNVGIALVVPATRILEVLRHPTIEKTRALLEEQLKKYEKGS